MRERLIQYVDLLFAGAPEAADIKQEILQNTLDRFDDLIAQGKTPEAAYSLAIAGIGDVGELLNSDAPVAFERVTPPMVLPAQPAWKKILKAIAIFLYIISIIPLIVLGDWGDGVLGLCATISIVAVATVLIILSAGGKTEKEPEKKTESLTPRQERAKAIKKAVSSVGLAVYLVISFLTGAWHITWLIFPIIAAVEGLIAAFMDLKEDEDEEE